jgi:hypothetical protein
MRIKRTSFGWLLAVAMSALPASVVLASPGAGSGSRANAAHTAAAFATQAAEIRTQMRPGGRYAFLGASQRAIVDRDLTRIAALLEKRGSVNGLTDQEQAELINAQEEANALLTRTDDGRMVCRYEQFTGSRTRTKVCRTNMQWAELERRQQDDFQRAALQGRGGS